MSKRRHCGGKRHFRPGLYSSLAVLVLAPLFAGLAYWQLQRAAEKESIIERKTAAAVEGPLVLEQQSADALHLKSVLAVCAIDSARQLLLDNRVHQQRVGYEVLTPCRLSGQRTVLINRGWIAAESSRERLPNVAVDASGRRQFSGYFAIPGEGLRLGAVFDENDTSWPRRVQYADFDAISLALDAPVIRGVLYLDESDPLTQTYNWKPIAFGPEKHYGYALQWFALMVTLLVLYIVLNFRQTSPQDSS